MNHCDAQWIPAYAGMTDSRSAVVIFPDAFLRFNDYEILDNPGKVSARVAKTLAEKEYAAFRVAQDRTFESDFDRLVEKSGEMVKKGRES